MTTISFPNSPTTGQRYTAANGVTYVWDNEKWQSEASTFGTGMNYVLPPASNSQLGGVKIGANISVDVNGVISVPTQTQVDWNETNATSLDFIKNKPNIVTPVQSDWNQTNNGSLDYIKNKPSIPQLPANASGYLCNNGTGTLSWGSISANQLTNGSYTASLGSDGVFTASTVSAGGVIVTGSITIPNNGQAGSILSANGKGNIYFETDNSLNFIVNATYQHIFNADGTVVFGGGYIFPNTQGTSGQVLVYDPAGNGDYKLSWESISANQLINGSYTVTLDNSGNLNLPGVLWARASDNGSIVFTNDGTTNQGSIKVDGGLNMVTSVSSNYYVKRAGQDRLAITDTDTTLMAGRNLILQSNKNSTSASWSFNANSSITFPDTTVQTTAWTGSVAYSSVTGTPTIPSAFPSGGIIMWSGSQASIPSGWVLCNGSNGTPDLRDRFVIGAGNNYSVGATGGSKDAIVVSHTHSITDSGHVHYISGASKDDGNFSGSGGNTQDWGLYADAGSYSSNDPLHSYGRNSASATTGISVNSTGASGTNANLPPYYALCFIMKT